MPEGISSIVFFGKVQTSSYISVLSGIKQSLSDRTDLVLNHNNWFLKKENSITLLYMVAVRKTSVKRR